MMKNFELNFSGCLSLLLIYACEKQNDDLQPIENSTSSQFIVDSMFTNPLVPWGADPWVTQKDGIYYFTYTQGSKLVLYQTSSLSELALASPHDAWIPEPGMPYSQNIWAPELHQIDDKWYMYFAADDGRNANHRMYVVENSSEDPMQGEWILKGKAADPSDEWAIDGTVLDYKGERYMLWSGGDAGAPPQHIYIAKMSNPWTIDGEKVAIASPIHPWEMNGSAINEGPQVLINPDGQLHVVYSASGYWVDTYCLGLLTLNIDGDPMNPEHWEKKPDPVFSMRPESGAYGPGHNGFFKSPDGTEDWIIYHARSGPGGGNRNARIQKFNWNEDGTPHFGEPVKIGEPIKKPSGEPLRKVYRTENWSIAGYSSEELVNGRLAIKLIDNDVNSFWITRYSTSPTNYPDHWITVDMGETLTVDGFMLAQKSGDRKIKELEILVGDNNETWESLGTFELANVDLAKQYFNLEVPRQFRFFKLVPISGHDDQDQPGLAEAATYILGD